MSFSLLHNTVISTEMAYVKFFRYFIEYKKWKFYFRCYLMIMRSQERIERNISQSRAHSALCNVIYCFASAVFKVDSATSLSETDM